MSRRANGLIRWLLLGTVAAASGLDAAAQSSRDVATRGSSTPELRDISGTWVGTFRLDSAWKLAQAPTAKSVRARLRFAPVGDVAPAASGSRSVQPGTYDIDFSQFGFALSTAEALGWSVSADSMNATLNPTVDHGLVHVHGAFRGETIVGTWRYVSDPGGAVGTFEVTRTAR